MQKLFIKNRKGKDIAVVVEEDSQAKCLAFVMHGLGGFKEQPHIQTFVNQSRYGAFGRDKRNFEKVDYRP